MKPQRKTSYRYELLFALSADQKYFFLVVLGSMVDEESLRGASE